MRLCDYYNAAPILQPNTMKNIYINKEPVDIDDKTQFNISYKSPLFSDLQQVVANTTLTIKLPKSAHNRAVIKSADAPGVQSDIPYKYLRVDVVEGGFAIIDNGRGYVIAISDTIEISVIFGGITAFASLKDEKLNEMQLPENTGLILWNDDCEFATAQTISDIMFVNADYGYFGGAEPLRYVHPCIRVPKIIEWINEAYGASIAPIGERLLVPCVEKKRYRSIKSAIFLAPAILREGKSVPIMLGNEIQYGIFGHTIHETAPNYYTQIRFTSGGKYRLSATATLPNLGGAVEITTFKVCKDGTWETYQKESADGYCDVGFEAKASYNFEVIMPSLSGLEGLGEITFSIKAVDDDMLYGEAFDVLRNLPPFKVIDFLKAIMQIEGVFPVTAGQSIGFVSVDEIYNNIAKTKDWSNKLLEHKSSLFRFGSFGKQNLLKWAEDDTVSVAASASGVLYVDNETIESTYDCVKLPFAACETSTWGMAAIPLYKDVAKDGQPTDIEYHSLKPRVVKLAARPGGIPVAEAITMNSIVADKYQKYQQAIRTPRVEKCTFHLSPRDIAGVDLTIPIYVEQLGAHYAIINLMVKENETEAELLEL